MKTPDLIKQIKLTCLNSHIASEIIKKVLDIEKEYSNDKKTCIVRMTPDDYREFKKYKLFKEFTKSEL
jgi:hypothetical protein